MNARPTAAVVVTSLLFFSLGCTDHSLPSAPRRAPPAPAGVVYDAAASAAQVLTPVAGATYNIATRINDAGDIVGISAGVSTLWQTGVLAAPSSTSPTVVDNGSGGEGYSINALGQIAGEYADQATLWTPNGGGGYTRTDIGTLLPGALRSTAWAVNAGGKVVGNFTVQVGSAFYLRCFLWTPSTPNGTVGTVTVPASDLGGGTGCTANDINSLGTIAGTSNLPSGIGHAFVWDGGASSALVDVTPGSPDQTYARAINDAGQLAGYHVPTGSRMVAAVWTPSGSAWSEVDLGAPALSGQTGVGMESALLDIDDAGFVVGYTHDQNVDRAFFWQNGKFTELPLAATAVTGEATSLTNPIANVVVASGADIVDPGATIRHALRWAVTLTPVTPQGCLADLAALIGQMQTDGTLRSSEAKSLLAKVDAATRQINQGNTTPARNVLYAFINEVNALVASGRLTAAQAQPLIDGAQCAIAAL